MDDPEGYLYRTAMNVFRSRFRRTALALKRLGRGAPPDDHIEAVERREVLSQALSALTPRERAAIVLTDVLGFTSEEAGDAYGIKPSTVRVLASRGRGRLEQEVMDDIKREHDPILERVRQELPASGDAFERLEHAAAKRCAGIVAGAVALGITGALVTGLVFTGSRSSGPDPDESVPGGTSPDGWTMPEGLAIPAGSFAYVHVVEYPGVGQPGTWFKKQTPGPRQATGPGRACRQRRCFGSDAQRRPTNAGSLLPRRCLRPR